MVGKVSKREAVCLPNDDSGYEVTEANGDRFYISAQFKRGELPVEFVLGNGQTYGDYMNAPLQPETRYKAYFRGVTEHNGVSFSSFSQKHLKTIKVSVTFRHMLVT